MSELFATGDGLVGLYACVEMKTGPGELWQHVGRVAALRGGLLLIYPLHSDGTCHDSVAIAAPITGISAMMVAKSPEELEQQLSEFKWIVPAVLYADAKQ